MIFINTDEVNQILGINWTTEDKKENAVMQANTWLSKLKICKGLDPISEVIKHAGALLAQESAKGLLYVTKADGTITEKTVKADTVSVSKKYATGQEIGKSAEMQFIDDLLSPFLCRGSALNTWVCK